MLREALNTRTISASYLRRLLPDEYKYDAKTRLDYKGRQKLEPILPTTNRLFKGGKQTDSGRTQTRRTLDCNRNS